MIYRTYTKNDYLTYEYYFENLHTFIEYISNEKTNTNVFAEDCLSSMRSGEHGRKFTKTSSLDEAIRLCVGGWNEKFDILLRLKNDIDEKILNSKIVCQRVKDFKGYAPSIPDYINGNPINMWNIVYTPNYEVIEMFVNVACSGYTETSAIYNKGAIILSIIDTLEKMGYGVKLTLFEFCTEGSEAFLSYFNIKDETENLNLKKSYFVLCHPSFLRRLGFRLKEVTPFKNRNWEDSYGKVDIKIFFDFFDFKNKNAIVFPSPNAMNINGENIYDDLKNVLKYTELDDIIKVS